MWNCCIEACRWGDRHAKLKKKIVPFPGILK
jgi:hypothetical protein